MINTIMKKYQLKNLILLLIVVVAFIGCNSDDDETSCKTFLDCNNNTTWKAENKDLIDYIKFYDNQHSPIDLWEFNDDEGYKCYWSGNFRDLTPFEIIENSLEKLMIKFDFDDGNINDGNYIISTMTVEGDELKWISKHFRDDAEYGNGTFSYFYKTSDNLDNLNMCD